MSKPRKTRRSGCRPAGFTLVELLVVIAIIGILIALLMPSVQSARESGRRTQCASNMRNVAIAVRNYATREGVLPAAGVVDETKASFDPKSGNQLSWVVLILPMLDQENLFDRFDVTKPVFAQVGDPQATYLSIMACPSDRARGRYFADSSLTGGRRFAKGNFAAFVSPFHTDLTYMFPGALAGRRTQTFGSLKRYGDGQSNTFLISEVRTREHEQDQRGAWALPWTGSTLLAFDMHHSGAFQAPYRHNPASLGVTQRPNGQGPNFDMIYNCADPAAAQLERMPCSSWAPSGSYRYLSAAARSEHPGGVNTAMLGGSVKFVPNGIDELVYAYSISTNDDYTENLAEFLP